MGAAGVSRLSQGCVSVCAHGGEKNVVFLFIPNKSHSLLLSLLFIVDSVMCDGLCRIKKARQTCKQTERLGWCVCVCMDAKFVSVLSKCC